MGREFYGPTGKAERAVNKLLSLPATGREQDWEFEMADPARVGEMLEALFEGGLNDDETRALALLTIASMEELQELSAPDPKLVARAKDFFGQNADVREAMIFYWIEQRRGSDRRLLDEVLSV